MAHIISPTDPNGVQTIKVRWPVCSASSVSLLVPSQAWTVLSELRALYRPSYFNGCGQWRRHARVCQGKCPGRNASAHAVALAVKLANKTKVMKIGKWQGTDRIVIEEVSIEEVDDFCYLGSVMSSNSSCDKEIKTRMGKANAVFGRLEKIWKSNGCSVDTKVWLYESIVLSTLLYVAETWPITVANGRRLEAAHHRWLRRILHVTWRDKITR